MSQTSVQAQAGPGPCHPIHCCSRAQNELWSSGTEQDDNDDDDEVEMRNFAVKVEFFHKGLLLAVVVFVALQVLLLLLLFPIPSRSNIRAKAVTSAAIQWTFEVKQRPERPPIARFTALFPNILHEATRRKRPPLSPFSF